MEQYNNIFDATILYFFLVTFKSNDLIKKKKISFFEHLHFGETATMCISYLFFFFITPNLFSMIPNFLLRIRQ